MRRVSCREGDEIIISSLRAPRRFYSVIASARRFYSVIASAAKRREAISNEERLLRPSSTRGLRPLARGPRNDASAQRGFTLIELLIAAAIGAMIALAVGATFAGGLKIYNSIESRGGARTDVLLGLEKMERDLRSMLALSDITFNGGPKNITFAGIVNSSLGSVTYYLDEKKENLIRKEANYPQALAEGDTGEIAREKLIPVKDIAFTYFIYDAGLESYEWTDSWVPESALEKEVKTEGEEETKDEGRRINKDGEGDIRMDEGRGTKDEGGGARDEDKIPLGVKIELSYEDGGKDVTRARTVFMPVAVSRHMAMLAKQREEEAEESEE